MNAWRRLVSCTLLLTAALAGAALSLAARTAERSILVLVAIDGFRWDYLSRFEPPALAELARTGVKADGLIPVFPSKTFPNHYTMVTGLYPARHGLLSNNIVDPALPGRFTLANRDVQQDTRWWGGEPIWITAERQGQRAGTMFWPGSDVEIAGRRPTYWRMFDHDLPNDHRVDQALVWMRHPEDERPTFLTVYFNTVDTIGHDHGPDSTEVRVATAEVDRAIRRLLDGIRDLGLSARTNVVIVSDHGMAATSSDRVILLDDYLDVAIVDVIDWSPILGLSPRTGSVNTLYRALKDQHRALDVYTRDTLPARFGLAGHPRLPAIIGIADDGWTVTSRARLARGEAALGDHGYDPRHRSMHGLFVASGPAFQAGMTVPAFENVHLYALLCSVLGLTPATNDGDLQAVQRMLR